MDAYEQALRRLLEVPSSPRLGLARMHELLRGLGDPHRRLRAIHVAGTNGKGSTCAFIDAILRSAGYRTGLTTSPHLSSARERIQVAGSLIPVDRFVALERDIAGVATAMSDVPTFFERMVAMAFLHFAEQAVDIAVVEVGLGGRLDATNVLLPVACAVTRLGLDHQAFLGERLADIAAEKAGIFKPGVPAFTVPQDPEAALVLRQRAAALGIPLRVVAPDAFPGPAERSLPGPHQGENAALARACVRAVFPELGEDVIREGWRRARWPGRFEQVRNSPPLWLDGAHNPDGARALVQAIRAHPECRDRPIHLMVGKTRGHDAAAFAQALRELAPASVRAVRARAPRSSPAAEVQERLEQGGLRARAVEDWQVALAEAEHDARASGGLVLVTGSLYLVGEVRAALLDVPTDPALPEF